MKSKTELKNLRNAKNVWKFLNKSTKENIM